MTVLFGLVVTKKIELPYSVNIKDKNIKCSEADEDGDVYYTVNFAYRDDEDNGGEMIDGMEYNIRVQPEGLVRVFDEMGDTLFESDFCETEKDILVALCDAVKFVNKELDNYEFVEIEE